ncbi:LOW QUALITY PROTEIN: armadillo repeat-containing protein 7 [Cylas formicarius]|uniref:LOW QUALITY PROTEIN: armadillo repeat-containing protein 7 n=1 Tax=Cylas formicarius TaxID=197179 RepID=UPI002958747A|nr:LOW QUALITY PROTEIN: armadillo repeat-containing protein 7 [Cylas formicarius]
MFSRKDQIKRKTGEHGIGRYEFLKQLVNEFAATKSFEAQRQTLANLANFAYDPVNYEYIKQLHIVDLFLAQLSENSEELIHFALAGLCNIICDPESREYIISLNGVYLISKYLLHENEDIALNSITTLFYLFESKTVKIPESLLPRIQQYVNNANIRYHNLGKIFVDTYYPSDVMADLMMFYRLMIRSLSCKTVVLGQEACLTKTITLRDVQKFVDISGDSNPIHLATNGNRVVVHGAFLNAIISRVIGTKLPGPGTLVVRQNLNFPNKCYVGDTIEASVRVEDIRKIIKVSFKCQVKTESKVVLYGDAYLVRDKS